MIAGILHLSEGEILFNGHKWQRKDLEKIWWLLPSSIPIRLMCPIFGLLPNGLSILKGRFLANTAYILENH